ncbi:KAP family NTPase [Nitrosomonas sp. Is24]|uniref:KAP family P-loop NTPase fold protein n=1 Tax=Nitrosomonas sp. Is24 TaxID=3080533 RepID=UPI00294B7B2A|nr:KAP family NTPase [Nitrosomonas sp. Is24]MDV6340622.1 KAP family NTPase [Nitrosomonas sp. Is24]
MTTNPSFLHDLPAANDAFGREHFAERLAHSLVLPNSSPGLVVGIEGEWGSGKSTLIGFIAKNLRENERTIVIDFNPWMVSATSALVEALIGQIAASINKNTNEGQNGIDISQKLLNYASLLISLKYIPGFSWIGLTAEDAIKAAQGALDGIRKLLPNLDLAQKKNEVIEALQKSEHSIIVIVDDLDRLPAEEVRIMIQAIKAVADFPQITYLLAYDPNIIARALAENEKSGLFYLEKIVQVAYPLPPLSRRQLKRFADGKIQELLKQLNITLRTYEKDRYEEAIVLMIQLSRHPRDVIRITNRLYLSLPATQGEVNAADVIAFEALTQRFPAIRKAVLEHSADFTGHFFRGDLISEQDAFYWGVSLGSREDEAEQTWLKHLPKDGEHDLQIANKTCLFLFEKNSKDGYDFEFEDQLRIADPDRLARLLSLTSIEEVPEATDIHKFLMEPEELEKELNREDDEGKLFLLNWLSNYARSCEKPDIRGCINKLTKISQKLTSDSLLTKELARGITDLMICLLRLKQPNYEQCFQDIVNNSPLSISVIVLFIAEKNQENHTTKNWSDQVRKSIRENNLFQEIYLHLILHRFTQLNDNDNSESYAAIDQMCKTEEGLAAFLKIFTQESLDHATNELMQGIIQSIKGKDASSLETSSYKGGCPRFCVNGG